MDMFEIGRIEGYPVMRCDELKDMGVIESVTNEQIVEMIKNTKDCHDAIHCGLINGEVAIVTWCDKAQYKDIPYKIELIRKFYVGYMCRDNEGNKIVRLEEDYSDTRFVITFTGKSKDLVEFFLHEMANNWNLESMNSICYIDRTGKTRNEAEKNVARDIDKILKYMLPKYIKGLNKEIDELEAKKAKCNKVFALKHVVKYAE